MCVYVCVCVCVCVMLSRRYTRLIRVCGNIVMIVTTVKLIQQRSNCRHSCVACHGPHAPLSLRAYFVFFLFMFFSSFLSFFISGFSDPNPTVLPVRKFPRLLPSCGEKMKLFSCLFDSIRVYVPNCASGSASLWLRRADQISSCQLNRQ